VTTPSSSPVSAVRSADDPIRVGVFGARGRMGAQVCRAVEAAGDMEVVAMVDSGDWMFDIVDAGAEVVVDFTHPDVVMDNLRFCVDQGIHAVVGTTGFDDERLATLRTWLEHKPEHARTMTCGPCAPRALAFVSHGSAAGSGPRAASVMARILSTAPASANWAAPRPSTKYPRRH
jgi:hypothetical protein